VTYRVVFDVSDRIPQIAIGGAALLIFVVAAVTALWDFDALLGRWPLVLMAGSGLLGLEALVDRQPLILGFALLFGLVVLGAERTRQTQPPVDLATRRRRPLPPGGAGTMAGSMLLVFATLFGLPMLPALGLTRELSEGRVEVLEGPVTIEFEVSGGKNECIAVTGRSFCYSDWLVTPGFNRTRALGGPMRDGLPVRLTLVDDTIVRVEIADGP
jgi:hypothetical protein